MSDLCSAVWSGQPCGECPHPGTCHEASGCHVSGCPCLAQASDKCGIEVVRDPNGGCVEYSGDYRCGYAAADHCLVADADELHLCRESMVHVHPFAPPLRHVTEPRWQHHVRVVVPAP